MSLRESLYLPSGAKTVVLQRKCLRRRERDGSAAALAPQASRVIRRTLAGIREAQRRVVLRGAGEGQKQV